MPPDESRATRAHRGNGTGEQPGTAAKAGPRARPIFVVQEHHASRLHYDLRLEADGVLKSWAVPKEPTLDPSVKRLAVEVEDHPLGYASFAGEIPRGRYGGGTVAIWDHGTYEDLSSGRSVVEALADGRLEFALHGEKLRGAFALIRMKARGRGKPQWLLVKKQDEFAAVGPPEAGESDEAPPPRSRARSGKALVQPPPASAPPEAIELTHGDKLMYPEAGLTKADVFAYYRKVAPRLLPFLKDRPITLERLPDGLSGPDAPHFWQKDAPDYYPDWIPRVAIRAGRGKVVRYIVVNDEPTLLYLVNQGALTFHVWASRVQDLDRPDFVLFDLDPGDAAFDDVIAVALAVRDELTRERLDAQVKTSGKSGLHVLAPWTGEGGHDEARAWASDVAGRVAAATADRATTDIRKVRRKGRVYIDVMQNARGHHAVPPYVLRAIPRATVSTPIAWREVRPGLDPAAFTADVVLARLARRKADPMAVLLGAPR
ncbi:non-homologous end-joining DNA ligase [Paludisphaera soli]|uniref:non-homologous end-joining DNA ligase n=1 Tax=Paludisphaera soli TaxID=2712865 RepID=UPI0013ED03FF|nr:non-homologous end-joining DNA ligase [Paludisphaera soli]